MRDRVGMEEVDRLEHFIEENELPMDLVLQPA